MMPSSFWQLLHNLLDHRPHTLVEKIDDSMKLPAVWLKRLICFVSLQYETCTRMYHSGHRVIGCHRQTFWGSADLSCWPPCLWVPPFLVFDAGSFDPLSAASSSSASSLQDIGKILQLTWFTWILTQNAHCSNLLKVTAFEILCLFSVFRGLLLHDSKIAITWAKQGARDCKFSVGLSEPFEQTSVGTC